MTDKQIDFEDEYHSDKQSNWLNDSYVVKKQWHYVETIVKKANHLMGGFNTIDDNYHANNGWTRFENKFHCELSDNHYQKCNCRNCYRSVEQLAKS